MTENIDELLPMVAPEMLTRAFELYRTPPSVTVVLAGIEPHDPAAAGFKAVFDQFAALDADLAVTLSVRVMLTSTLLADKTVRRRVPQLRVSTANEVLAAIIAAAAICPVWRDGYDPDAAIDAISLHFRGSNLPSAAG